MKRLAEDFLRDILAYGEKALETIAKNEPKTLNRFSDGGMVIILCLEIIGEAVKNVPLEIKNTYPKLEWKQAAGMRDILVHSYWRTNFSIITDTVLQDLPPFLEGIKQILSELSE